MKNCLFLITLAILFHSCSGKQTTQEPEPSPIIGTWKLLAGTTIKDHDTTVVDYTKGQEMMKIITATHFSFLRHDLNHGKDSTAVFVAGGGRVQISDSTYAEYLDYCNLREWEGGKFDFRFQIMGDTLTITGMEKVEELGIDHLNIETYLKVK